MEEMIILIKKSKKYYIIFILYKNYSFKNFFNQRKIFIDDEELDLFFEVFCINDDKKEEIYFDELGNIIYFDEKSFFNNCPSKKYIKIIDKIIDNKENNKKVNDPSENYESSKYPKNKDLAQEIDFLNFLYFLIQKESNIENVKKKIVFQDDFSLHNLFYLFDRSFCDIITIEDLYEGYKLFGINTSYEDIELVFNRYNYKQNDYLDFEEFINMMLTKDLSCQNLILSRGYIANKDYFRSLNFFSLNTRDLIKKNLQCLLNTELDIKKEKNKINTVSFKDFISNSLFKKFNLDNFQFIIKDEFKQYLTNSHIFFNNEDFELLFSRLDRKNREIVEINDFIREIIIDDNSLNLEY